MTLAPNSIISPHMSGSEQAPVAVPTISAPSEEGASGVPAVGSSQKTGPGDLSVLGRAAGLNAPPIIAAGPDPSALNGVYFPVCFFSILPCSLLQRRYSG